MESTVKMKKDSFNNQNVYKKAENKDVLTSIKKCTKKYNEALRNLAK